MTYKEIASMIESIGLPFAYYQFSEDTAEAPPFVVFFYSQTADLYADDLNFQRIEQLNIELYTSEKDFELEARIEKLLNDHGLTYYREENYLDSEKMFQIAYEMEVTINA